MNSALIDLCKAIGLDIDDDCSGGDIDTPMPLLKSDSSSSWYPDGCPNCKEILTPLPHTGDDFYYHHYSDRCNHCGKKLEV